MSVVTPPFVQQGGSHPAATFREMLAAAAMTPAASFAGGIQATTAGGGHGVVGGGDFAVTQNGTPDMTVIVAAGSGFVRGTEALAQGVYASFNDAPVSLAVSAADPTNARKDLVVLKARDAFYSGASTDMSLAIVTGTPAASPSDPSIPANALVLARITVPAAATSVITAYITDLRTFATALGGVQRCTSTTRPTSSSLFEGLYIDESDTNRLWRYDGANWVLVEGAHPNVQLTRSTGQTIAVSTNSVVTWDTEVYDTDSIHSTSVNTSRLTVPAGLGGLWLAGYTATWATGVDNSGFAAWIQVNGNVSNRYAYVVMSGLPSGVIPLALAAGDYIELGCFQSTAGPVAFANSINDRFWMTRLGPSA